MQQQALLRRSCRRHPLPHSNSSKLQHNTCCRAAQCCKYSTRSTQQKAAHRGLVHVNGSTAKAVSSSIRRSNLPAIHGQSLLQAAAVALLQLHLALAGHAAELVESNLSSEGNIPSELSAAGETAAPALSSLMSGSNKKQVEGCTRKCVPTCIRGGEGSPGLGPLSVRKEIVVFKDGFRSRQYCLSECAQVCSLKINKDSSSSSSGVQHRQQLGPAGQRR